MNINSGVHTAVLGATNAPYQRKHRTPPGEMSECNLERSDEPQIPT